MVSYWRRSLCPSVTSQRCWAQLNRQTLGCMKMRRIGAVLFVSLTAAFAAACQSTPRPVDHTVSIALLMILARPEEMPSPQPINVRGFLARRSNMWLFLSSEHAAADDFSSAITVSPPTEEFLAAPCTDHFVEISGTLVRSSSGELFLRDVEKVTIPKSIPASLEPLREIFPEQCWP